MKTIKKLEELKPSELERIRTTLFQRYDIGKSGNIVEVAFGMAEQNGTLDSSRRDSICFYVRHKRMPRSRVDRIPECIEIRLRRGSKFVLVCLLTDVINIGPRNIRPTGRKIRHLQSQASATTGCVVVWKTPDQTRFTWGLLSVGHQFKHVATVPESTKEVRICSATIPVKELQGTLLARSRPSDTIQIDAALVEVFRESLVKAKLIPENVSTVGKKVRIVDKLKLDRDKPGFTFPEQSKLPFVVARYLPVSDIVPVLGSLRNVLEVNSTTGNAFGPGRSGSLWVVANQVACLQHAGLEFDFLRGWGQSLESILEWATKKVATIEQVPISKIDMRLIRII